MFFLLRYSVSHYYKRCKINTAIHQSTRFRCYVFLVCNSSSIAITGGRNARADKLTKRKTRTRMKMMKATKRKTRMRMRLLRRSASKNHLLDRLRPNKRRREEEKMQVKE